MTNNLKMNETQSALHRSATSSISEFVEAQGAFDNKQDTMMVCLFDLAHSFSADERKTMQVKSLFQTMLEKVHKDTANIILRSLINDKVWSVLNNAESIEEGLKQIKEQAPKATGYIGAVRKMVQSKGTNANTSKAKTPVNVALSEDTNTQKALLIKWYEENRSDIPKAEVEDTIAKVCLLLEVLNIAERKEEATTGETLAKKLNTSTTRSKRKSA